MILWPDGRPRLPPGSDFAYVWSKRLVEVLAQGSSSDNLAVRCASFPFLFSIVLLKSHDSCADVFHVTIWWKFCPRLCSPAGAFRTRVNTVADVHRAETRLNVPVTEPDTPGRPATHVRLSSFLRFFILAALPALPRKHRSYSAPWSRYAAVAVSILQSTAQSSTVPLKWNKMSYRHVLLSVIFKLKTHIVRFRFTSLACSAHQRHSAPFWKN